LSKQTLSRGQRWSLSEEYRLHRLWKRSTPVVNQ
jgi:hypothetical protein